MELKKASKLATLLTAGAMLFSPLKSYSQTIGGHIGNILKKNHYSEQGEGIPAELLFRNLSTNDSIKIRTDEHGDYFYDPDRIIIPNYVYLERLREFSLYDLIGRSIETIYDPSNVQNLVQSTVNERELPTGTYFYGLSDDLGNSFRGKFGVVEREVKGLTLPKIDLESRINNGKSKDRISNVQTYEVTIRDEDTEDIGDFYDWRDTLNIDISERFELDKDLIPVWEIEEDTVGRNYRNNLHQVKWMTQTDIEYYPENERYSYMGKWYSYPVDISYNRDDDQGHNVEALEISLRNWEDSTRYENYRPLDVYRESESPEKGILMDYTSRGASGTDIANEWETYFVNGQRFYAPKIVTVYIGNTLGDELSRALLINTEHEIGHATMASRAHSMNNVHAMAGGSGEIIKKSESLTLRYIVLEKPFTTTFNYLED